ncbi:hypothetical protein J8340_23120 [Escherichia coli]|nr:hypothetical protein [Escherichia coli]
MDFYNKEIVDYFLKFINDEIALTEFERWFNSNSEELKYYLAEEDYTSLLSIEYASEDAEILVKEQVQRILDTPSYAHEEMIKLIEELINHEEKYVQCCRQIYNAYCDGYYFLKEIALTSITYDFNHRLEQPENMKGLLDARPFIIQEAVRLLEYMKIGEIKIVEEYWVIDSRDKMKPV